MSKAEVVCPYCDKEWTYMGLSATSCYCPRCSGEVLLDSPNAEVLDDFGVADLDSGFKTKDSGSLVEPIHMRDDDEEEEDYIEPSDEETELIDDLGF